MLFERFDRLRVRFGGESQEDYPITSRIHLLQGFSHSRCFVKRDDELGFSISGTKFRKYRTLIPYLSQYEEVVVIGGAFSNHVLAISQLLIENQIQPVLFLKGVRPLKPCGNFLFLQMLLPVSSIHWVSKDQWPQVDALVAAYTGPNTKILPEGAPLFAAFLGALSLPLDIVRNEQERGLIFDHIFFEVGTGYSAAALLLGLSFIGKHTTCHLLLMAGSEEDFRQQLAVLHGDFERWLGEKCPFPVHFICERSSIAPSFGSTNKELFDFIIETARTEGFFLDPIYSGKLFYHAKNKIDAEKLSENILIIHSGGALSLSGFQELLVSRE